MAYYRIAIVAPMEYQSDDPVWRCYEDLRTMGHAVEVIDPRKYPSVMKPDGSLDESEFAAFRERFRPDLVSFGGQSAQEAVEAAAAVSAGNEFPASHFAVFGYVGKLNFGDELIFSLICDGIEKRFPNACVSLIGHDPQTALRVHGVHSITCDMKLEADIMLEDCRALVYMAGIMFDDPFVDWTAGPIDLFLNPRSEIAGQVAFALMASIHGVPSVGLGIGAGPLANPDAKRLVALQARNGMLYLPRDAQTCRLLSEAGVPDSSIRQKADLAFSLEPALHAGEARPFLCEHGLEQGGYVLVSLRNHRTVPEGFEGVVALSLDRVVEKTGVKVLFADLAPEDRFVHERVASAMTRSDAAVVYSDCEDLGALVDLIANARAVLAMRLHASIVATVCGVPAVGFDYNEKVSAFFDLAGLADFLLPMGAGSDDIAGALANVFDGASCERSVSARGEEGEGALGRLRSLALEAFDELSSIARSVPKPDERSARMFYSRSVSIEENALIAVRAERDELLREVERLRHDLDEMAASTTWKAGRAVTKLPRSLKDRFGR